MSTLWPLLLVAVVGILLGLLLAAGPSVFRGTRRVEVHAFPCPIRGQAFDVEFEVTAWDGARVDVTRCAAFQPDTAVSCAKACLRPVAASPGARVAV